MRKIWVIEEKQAGGSWAPRSAHLEEGWAEAEGRLLAHTYATREDPRLRENRPFRVLFYVPGEFDKQDPGGGKPMIGGGNTIGDVIDKLRRSAAIAEEASVLVEARDLCRVCDHASRALFLEAATDSAIGLVNQCLEFIKEKTCD